MKFTVRLHRIREGPIDIKSDYPLEVRVINTQQPNISWLSVSETRPDPETEGHVVNELVRYRHAEIAGWEYGEISS